MSKLKRCKQCGILKDIEEFRKHTYAKANNTEGHYSICRSCESINSTYKRVEKAIDNGSTEQSVLESHYKINELYTILEARGLSTPRLKVASRVIADPIVDTVDKLKDFYQAPSSPQLSSALSKGIAAETVTDVTVPDDLKYWLETPFDTWREKSLDPEYLQETVYESLKAKYRPQIGMDPVKFVPVYDDTYKAALNEILRRFDDYEEEMTNDDQ